MKTISQIITGLFLLLVLQSSAQKYKTRSDSTKLNLEYARLQSEITQLELKRNEAQTNLPVYRDKEVASTLDAQNSAAINANNANASQNGDLNMARAEKRSAKRAFKDAKIQKNDHLEVRNQNKKIQDLDREIQKKQQRLLELDSMRSNLVD